MYLAITSNHRMIRIGTTNVEYNKNQIGYVFTASVKLDGNPNTLPTVKRLCIVGVESNIVIVKIL